MKKIILLTFLLFSFCGIAQDLNMENGTFIQCTGNFYDSGGEFGNYDNDENYVTTICPENADQFMIVDFTSFSTQLNLDYLVIYDGDDTSAPVIGTYSGVVNPGEIVADTAINPGGCLTFEFVTNGSGVTTGFAADIYCVVPCQTITPFLVSTVPAPNGSGVIGINPGDTIEFTGDATFSDYGGDGAVYNWNFGNGSIASGQTVTNTFPTPGTYSVTLTVEDGNPLGCDGQAIVTTVFVLGDNIVVEEDTFTVQELVEDVLINNDCAQISNITSSTGTDFGQTPNGIGYFFGNGVSFPFKDGIILSTGDAEFGEGPNTGTSSGASWDGDPDLDIISGENTNDATLIEFDFVPLADFISFNFIMASEEYNGGSFECNYSDTFAFLLTDEAGVTTNLAVLPGTTTPIAVTNIHQANSSCPAINEEYFGGYTPDNAPPIKFDGRTIVFAAESAVNAGESYHIKLVIADARDHSWDSAVFLEAGSFDLGGELGDDITIAAGTALCSGEIITLDTGASLADHVWYKDGVEIPGEVTSVLEVTETGEYTMELTFGGDCSATDSIYIEFKPSPIVEEIENLAVCSTESVLEWDLTQNTGLVIGTQDPTLFNVTYHLTEQDALDNTNEIVTPETFSNTSNPQTVWVRIEEMTGECYATAPFDLFISPDPTPITPTALEVCDDDGDGFSTFDLTLKDTEITGGVAGWLVSYHETYANAENDVDEVTSPYANISPNDQTIFARVQVDGAECYAIVELLLVVNPLPEVTPISNYELCDYRFPGDMIEEFDLSTKDIEILNGQTGITISYHTLQEDADTGINAISGLYTNTSDTQTIFVRLEDDITSCFITTTFDIVVNPLPVVIIPTALEVCYDISDDITDFTLSDKTSEILGGQTNINVSFHETQLDAEDNLSPLAEPYNIPTNTATVFVRLEDLTTGCYNTTTLDLVINDLPVITAPTPLEACDDDNDGFTSFDLTLKDTEVLNGQAGISVSYHETESDASTGVNALTSPYNNIVPNTQDVFVRLENDVTGCHDTVALMLIVNSLPSIPTITAYELCDYNLPGDEMESFDLTTKDAEVLNGQAGLTVSYHETMADAELGLNAIVGPYVNALSNPQPIYVNVTNVNS
ncbi:MAG: hypothetical protein BM564_07030, partial [Bacteroidetes bacterium MedPE-SWsnd-G2]